MLDELSDFTLESIVGVYFGDYATLELLEEVKRYVPTITKSVFSVPLRFPWPLNKLALFGFGKSIDARAAFSVIVHRVVDERRADLSSAREGSSSAGGKSAGILDSLFEIQQGQEGFFDDDFIVDQVRTDRLWLEDSRALFTCIELTVRHIVRAANRSSPA